MMHESIVVVYDNCQAIADVIAYGLGAVTVSAQNISNRQVENCQSLVLALECQEGGQLNPHWQYVSNMLGRQRLDKKRVAILVASGNRQDNGSCVDALQTKLKENGARIVGDLLYTANPHDNLLNWVSAISPSL